MQQLPHIACEHCQSLQLSFMKDCSADNFASLNEHKHCKVFKKGQDLFHEDGRPTGLYCINSGKVKLYKTGSEGKSQILDILSEGAFLGYRALIAEEMYHHSATALEDTSVCFIPKSVFLQILESNPMLAKQLLKSLCHDFGIAEDRLKNMAQKSVSERLAETLLLLAHSFKKQYDESASILIDVSLPREDIANLVGTATETVIRLLSDFKDKGVVLFEKKKIKIVDLPKLKKLAGEITYDTW